MAKLSVLGAARRLAGWLRSAWTDFVRVQGRVTAAKRDPEATRDTDYLVSGRRPGR